MYFKKENGTTLKAAWEMYKTYCDDAKVGFPVLAEGILKRNLKTIFMIFRNGSIWMMEPVLEVITLGSEQKNLKRRL